MKWLLNCCIFLWMVGIIFPPRCALRLCLEGTALCPEQSGAQPKHSVSQRYPASRGGMCQKWALTATPQRVASRQRRDFSLWDCFCNILLYPSNNQASGLLPNPEPALAIRSRLCQWATVSLKENVHSQNYSQWNQNSQCIVREEWCCPTK